MDRKLILLSAISLLLVSQIALASVSTVSTSMSTSRATTGTSITSTVTVTATSSESGSVQLVCSPSGTTISDPATGQYQGVSLSTSPTSKTFTLTAGTANTYTCQGQSGGVTGDATIVFVEPSALTVTGTPASKSTSKTSAYALSVNVQNSQSDSITTSYSLSCGSHTCSGDSESGTITVAAGTTTALTWTVTVGGTSASSTITFALGDNTNAFSSAVSCSDCVTSSTTPTPAPVPTPTAVSSPGVKVTTESGKATITIPSIATGNTATAVIPKTENVAITQIIVAAKNTISNMEIVVKKLADKPSTVAQVAPGSIYHYIQIDKNISDTSINETIIRFEVTKSWLANNSVNKSTVALNRYSNDTWNKLQTTEMSDDGTVVLYEATSPGLSIFAISGENGTATTPTPTPGAPQGTPTTIQETVDELKKNTGWIISIVLVFVIVVGGLAYLKMKGIIKFDKIMPIKKKSNWDELKKKYNRK